VERARSNDTLSTVGSDRTGRKDGRTNDDDDDDDDDDDSFRHRFVEDAPPAPTRVGGDGSAKEWTPWNVREEAAYSAGAGDR